MISRCIKTGVLAAAATVALAAQAPARYDRTQEQTFSGTIRAVASYPTAEGAVGVHLDLQTADALLDVRIGPATFIGQENFWFFAEDKLVVIGARVSGPEGPIWARAIQRGSTVLALRTDDGTPRWSPATNGTDGCGVNHPPIQRTTLH
jgi:hypothetical protein